MLRPVMVMKYISNKKVDDHQGLFHQWSLDYEEFEYSIGNYGVGIVEREDGTIEMPAAHFIRFLDAKTHESVDEWIIERVIAEKFEDRKENNGSTST